jgi:hypothetical protein
VARSFHAIGHLNERICPSSEGLELLRLSHNSDRASE